MIFKTTNITINREKEKKGAVAAGYKEEGRRQSLRPVFLIVLSSVPYSIMKNSIMKKA
jgi:hypothetical protein